MGFFDKLFSGGGGKNQRIGPDTVMAPPPVTEKQLDQSAFLVQHISNLILDTLFDDEVVPTGKTFGFLGTDPYISGFIFGMSRETAKTMGVGIDERASIVIASGVSAFIFGKLPQPTDPNAPEIWERGNVNGQTLAQFMKESLPPDEGPDPLHDLWIDYVLYNYGSDEFRASEDFEDIVPQP